MTYYQLKEKCNWKQLNEKDTKLSDMKVYDCTHPNRSSKFCCISCPVQLDKING